MSQIETIKEYAKAYWNSDYSADKEEYGYLRFNNLNFGLSSSNSEGFTSQILGFFSKAIAEGAIAEEKSTRDASKVPEGEGEKPEVQVNKHANLGRVISLIDAPKKVTRQAYEDAVLAEMGKLFLYEP